MNLHLLVSFLMVEKCLDILVMNEVLLVNLLIYKELNKKMITLKC